MFLHPADLFSLSLSEDGAPQLYLPPCCSIQEELLILTSLCSTGSNLFTPYLAVISFLGFGNTIHALSLSPSLAVTSCFFCGLFYCSLLDIGFSPYLGPPHLTTPLLLALYTFFPSGVCLISIWRPIIPTQPESIHTSPLDSYTST